MENECELFSSRGLLKSCCMHADNVEYVGPHELTYKVDKINVRIRKTPSVYINIASLDFFCKNILPKLKAPIVLVIGDSDVSVPNTMFTLNFVVELLEHPKIKRWYCQNLCCRVQNLYPLPIGLDYHSQSIMDKWGEKAMPPLDQENKLLDIKQTGLPFWERECKCYVNFQYSLHHLSGEAVEYADIRGDALKNVDQGLCYFDKSGLSRSETWGNQTKYAFVISPPGNGLDCHRTWEALNLGCIPILVKVNFSDYDMSWQSCCYDDLPVLVVNRWDEINQELLDRTVVEFREKKFNYDKLTLKYWVDKIHE